MKYFTGQELICIKTLVRKRGSSAGQINFIKGKTYIVDDAFQKEINPAYTPIYIKLQNEQGEPQLIKGGNKTKYFKIPRPEGVPVKPPPPPKADKKKSEKQKKSETEDHDKEWKRVKKLKVKDASKKIFKRRASGF